MSKRILLNAIVLCAFFLVFSSNTKAQQNNIATKTVKATAKTGVVIVGKSAQFTYKAAKFTTKKVAKPIIVKSAPKVGKFMLNQSGKLIKSSFPVAKKLFIKYVKYKFSP